MKTRLTVFALSLMALWYLTDRTVDAVSIHIMPTRKSSCPEELCLTLSQFAANVDKYLQSNTTLILQEGNHSLDTVLVVENVDELTIFSTGAIILHEEGARIHLKHVTRVHIQGITFIGVRGNKVESVKNFTIQHSSFSGMGNGMVQGNSLTCDQQNNTGSALELVDSKAMIVNSSFVSNVFGKCRDSLDLKNIKVHLPVHIGGAIFATKSSVTIIRSNFERNRAEMGGAIYGDWSSFIITDSNFVENIATCSVANVVCNGFGGALLLHQTRESRKHDVLLKIDTSVFNRNKASGCGGAIVVYHVITKVSKSKFLNNSARQSGGVIKTFSRVTINLKYSTFSGNLAKSHGGVVSSTRGTYITFQTCYVSHNKALQQGGALHSATSSKVSIYDCIFHDNKAPSGGVMSITGVELLQIFRSKFLNNEIQDINNCSAIQSFDGILYLIDVTADLKNVALINNVGSLMVLSGIEISLSETNTFHNNSNSTCSTGGAVSFIQSEVKITGNCIMTDNHAVYGGAIYAANTRLNIDGHMTLANNLGSLSGGGIYFYQSELNCNSKSLLELQGNTAFSNGGGMHAISSIINMHTSINTAEFPYVRRVAKVTFIENKAKRGGGVYLEMNSKLYILKHTGPLRTTKSLLKFIANSAVYGGAIYVADENNYQTCAIYAECFIQELALYTYSSLEVTSVNNTFFSRNHADSNGSNLFGGLLDRCTVNPRAEVLKIHKRGIDGLKYMRHITNIKEDSISSKPVKVCFCSSNGLKNCSITKLHPPIKVMKGHNFTVFIVAVDQVSNNVNATVFASLLSNVGGLGENQGNQRLSDVCTNLTFSIVSPRNSAKLRLYADGPCKDATPSQLTLEVEFILCSCPIGFQPKADNTKCDCECDAKLYPYITECDYLDKTLIKKGSYWITHINNSDGYLIYPYCPLDYCKPPTSRVSIKLDSPMDIDLQCDNNRSGLLCGTCQLGYSLSLGSSRCIQCSLHWYQMFAVVLVAAFLAGIMLVALILILNLTIAVGTLNGIIFYANIMEANGSILFFSYSTRNFVIVFLEWLNLDIGFDACFFNGMDAYWKTLLQLAFPAYLIFLVIMIIIASEYSTRFGRLIGRKNPVATLATLILLSYTKLLRTIIAAFSFAVLRYPDSTSKVVWLPDATIMYLQGRHIFLFIASVLILLAGVTFTLILFFWQWFLLYQHKPFLKWVRYNKLKLFIEPYHAPYKFSHRYWTGLLLLVRAALYILFSVVTNPDGFILVIGILMVCLLLFKFYSGKVNGQIYRRWPVDVLETTCYVNIILFCLAKQFVLESSDQKGRMIVAYISGTITFVLFVVVLFYHLLNELISKTEIWKSIKLKLTLIKSGDTIVDNGGDISDSNERVPSEPTISVIDCLPQAAQPLSALVESGLKRELVAITSYGTLSADLHQRNKPKDKRCEHNLSPIDESAPLLAEDEQVMLTPDKENRNIIHSPS